MNRDPMTLPGSLALSLADAEMWKLLGLHVDARDLGCVASTTPRAPGAEGLPFLVVTARTRWAMGWTPTTPQERRLHTAYTHQRDLDDQAAVAYVADQDAQAASTELVPVDDGGSDADDWDVDDNSPANNPGYWEGLEQANAAEEDRLLERAKAALATAGLHDAAHTYHVHNPFTGMDAWFTTAEEAREYACAASDADHLDHDFGVWSAAGFGAGEYWLYRQGREYSEADPDEVTEAARPS